MSKALKIYQEKDVNAPNSNVGAKSKMANGSVVKTKINKILDHTQITITKFPRGLGRKAFGLQHRDYPIDAEIISVNGLELNIDVDGEVFTISNMDRLHFKVTQYKYQMQDCVEVVKGFGANKKAWGNLLWNHVEFFQRV